MVNGMMDLMLTCTVASMLRKESPILDCVSIVNVVGPKLRLTRVCEVNTSWKDY